MRGFTFFVLFFLISLQSFTQNWSDPVTIFDEGKNVYQDFTIDRNGIIHCVWSHQITVKWYKIFYSKSIDHGLTWTLPYDICQNTTFKLNVPQIVSDTNGKLYVTYTYNPGDYTKQMIHLQIFDGLNWGQPILISENMPGSDHPRLVIDNNDKIYCFWYSGGTSGNIYYRFFENNQWSNIYIPFPGSDGLFFFNQGVVDGQNNLYCVGVHHYEGQMADDDHVIYFTYDNVSWSDFTELNDNTSWYGQNIDLNNGSLPVVVWGQQYEESGSVNIGVYISEFDNVSWSYPVLIAQDAKNSSFTIDKNSCYHIITEERPDTGFNQLVYYKREGFVWERTVLEESEDIYGYLKLISKDSSLYLIYIKLYLSDLKYESSSILFRRLDIKINSTQFNKNNEVKVYPNPFSSQVTIEMENPGNEIVDLTIYNIHGTLVYQVQKRAYGKEIKMNWNGKDLSGEKMASGLYYVQVLINKERITRGVIKME